jgi:ABC-type uncharacterized transport system permease subunit
MINLPWTYVSYHTSSTAVKFTAEAFLSTVSWQLAYIVIFFILIMLVFKKGADALNVNGG